METNKGNEIKIELTMKELKMIVESLGEKFTTELYSGSRNSKKIDAVKDLYFKLKLKKDKK